MDKAKLKCISPNLNEVVEQSTHPSQRIGRGKESHVAELNKHFQVEKISYLENASKGGLVRHGEFVSNLEIGELVGHLANCIGREAPFLDLVFAEFGEGQLR